MAELAAQTRATQTGSLPTHDHAAVAGAGHLPVQRLASADMAESLRHDALVAQARALNNGPRVTALYGAAATVQHTVQRRAVVQRIQINALLGDAEDGPAIAARLGALIVNPPAADNEAERDEFHQNLVNAAGYWQNLAANEIGVAAADQRQGLVAALHEGDAPTGLLRVIPFYLGLRDRPAEPTGAIESLALLRHPDGRIASITGRPGLFAIRTGGASQARRHMVAWHNLRNLMNRLIAQFGGMGVAEIARWVGEVADPDIARRSAEIAGSVVPMDGPDFRILWLAILLNNVPHNLWIGAARENISINTMVGHLRRWTEDLEHQRTTVADYRANVARYAAGSAMARRAIASILAEIDGPLVAEHPGMAHLMIVEHVRRTVLPTLEIDPMRGEEISPLQRFLYEAGEGMVAIGEIDQIIRALREFVEDPADRDGVAMTDTDGKGGADKGGGPGHDPGGDGPASSSGSGGPMGGMIGVQ